jgi:hypothetical protein
MFVFKNSVSKAMLDAHPNLVMKMVGLDKQVKALRATLDHMQTNLVQVRAHGNMAAMKPVRKRARKDGVEFID